MLGTTSGPCPPSLWTTGKVLCPGFGWDLWDSHVDIRNLLCFGAYSLPVQKLGHRILGRQTNPPPAIPLLWCLASALPSLNLVPPSPFHQTILLPFENKGWWLDKSQLHSVWKHIVIRLLGHQVFLGFCTYVLVWYLFIMSYMFIWDMCGFQDFPWQIFLQRVFIDGSYIFKEYDFL